MVETDEREFEYESFHDPANLETRQPTVMDDKKYICVERRTVRLV
jgi:hypothetical protein